jgi:hypothetical protein
MPTGLAVSKDHRQVHLVIKHCYYATLIKTLFDVKQSKKLPNRTVRVFLQSTIARARAQTKNPEDQKIEKKTKRRQDKKIVKIRKPWSCEICPRLNFADFLVHGGFF